MKKYKIYAIISKGTIWAEDFVDEDTGDVVSINRFEPQQYMLATIEFDLSYPRPTKKDLSYLLWGWFYNNSKEYRFYKALSENKFKQLTEKVISEKMRHEYPALITDNPIKWNIEDILKSPNVIIKKKK